MQQALYTELELLAGLAAGNRLAVKEVYNSHYPTVTKWIIKNGGNEVDADDIYQEAMTVLFEKAQCEDFRLTCKIGTYLFAVSKNLWYKKLQQSKNDFNPLPEEIANGEGLSSNYEEDINAHHERELHYEQLDSALEQLGEPCSSILKSFYNDGKSMQEIAADFGYTNPDNAKTQKYKCLTRLRKIFYSVQAK